MYKLLCLMLDMSNFKEGMGIWPSHKVDGEVSAVEDAELAMMRLQGDRMEESCG